MEQRMPYRFWGMGETIFLLQPSAFSLQPLFPAPHFLFPHGLRMTTTKLNNIQAINVEIIEKREGNPWLLDMGRNAAAT